MKHSTAWAGILQIQLLDFSAHHRPQAAPVKDPDGELASTQLRIMIVDDDPIVRTLLETWLKVDVRRSRSRRTWSLCWKIPRT